MLDEPDAFGRLAGGDGRDPRLHGGDRLGIADRFVVDRTGLEGMFRVELDWSPDQSGDAPSVFTALQEQLGLRLTASRAAVDVVVIDYVERPTED